MSNMAYGVPSTACEPTYSETTVSCANKDGALDVGWKKVAIENDDA
jgi:hypothetical protein